MAKLNETPVVLEDLDKEARAIQAAGLQYKPVEIKREEIDLVHSTTFNARFENRVDDDNVVRLAVLYERGVQLPRITVFYDSALKKYVVISGVHRVTGHELAGMNTPIPAFEVIVSPPGNPDTMQRIADLGVVLNNIGPLGLSHAETLAAAIRAVHDRGEDVNVVAQRYALKTEDINSAYENWKLDRELLQNGLTPSAFKRKSDKQNVLKLSSTEHMKEMQSLLIAFVDKRGNPIINGDQFANLVQQVKNEKNEVARQEIVTKARATLKAGKKVTKKTTASARASAQGRGRAPYFVWRQIAARLPQLSVAELVATHATSADAARTMEAEVQDVEKVCSQLRRALKARWEV